MRSEATSAKIPFPLRAKFYSALKRKHFRSSKIEKKNFYRIFFIHLHEMFETQLPFALNID